MNKRLSVENINLQMKAGRMVLLPAYVFSIITTVLFWLQENLLWIMLFFLLTLLHFRKLPFQFIIFLILQSALVFFLLSIFHQADSLLSAGPWEGEILISEKSKWNGDTLTGMGEVRVRRNKENIFIKYKSISELEKLKLSNMLLHGGKCTVTGVFSLPPTVSNPFVFDFPRFLTTNNTSFVLDIDRIIKCDMVGNTFARSPLLFFVNNKMDGSEWTKYVLSLVLGDRSLFSEQEINIFQQTGIIHLLAISGLHVGIIIAALTFISFRVGMLREIIYICLIFFIPFTFI
ncbi:DUF4131 domain-containing protein [Mangrovibacillus cuniculi]|uniref:DUF4131 domain-containing protein n=1 Tax=Mangrovibacillus cuniculi TaxID=2593652 RepID=A0A7S8CBJ2_9BACI|nr:ComEC/Rec2 family competence protein [Mangrovibacillus cuniculi]QPC46949.1 DUF4131 domain-containing protein [Mangrovibacillus cuniculi]